MNEMELYYDNGDGCEDERYKGRKEGEVGRGTYRSQEKS